MSEADGQELREICAALPGPYYMDPPDGGCVSVAEQVRRMARDAARYRWLRDDAMDAGDSWAPAVFPTDESCPLYGTALDETIDHYLGIREETRK